MCLLCLEYDRPYFHWNPIAPSDWNKGGWFGGTHLLSAQLRSCAGFAFPGGAWIRVWGEVARRRRARRPTRAASDSPSVASRSESRVSVQLQGRVLTRKKHPPDVRAEWPPTQWFYRLCKNLFIEIRVKGGNFLLLALLFNFLHKGEIWRDDVRNEISSPFLETHTSFPFPRI